VAERDRTTQLADGRVVGWSDLGDPEGHPVLWCHGGLSCRLDAMPGDGPARDAGVRLIAPDRPGIGLSSPRPGWTMLDAALDSVVLADHLEIDRFSVCGWSAGGVYALTCAAVAPDRVRHVGVVAGTTDLTDRAQFRLLAPLDQRLTRLCRSRPRVASSLFDVFARLEGLAPGMAAGAAQRGLSGAEQDELARHGGPRQVVDANVEAARQGGAGLVADYVAYSGAWPFRADQVVAPVTVWQGDADSLVARAFGEHLEVLLPDAELRLCPGAGHFLALDRWSEILTTVAGTR
jgi:pimeloyl-ACP methyl ester carboxylesterase